MDLKLAETDIDTRYRQLTQSMGGAEAFNAWLQANFYSDRIFPTIH